MTVTCVLSGTLLVGQNNSVDYELNCIIFWFSRCQTNRVPLCQATPLLKLHWIMCYDWLIDWGSTALSAQIGYAVPLISMLQSKKWNYWESWQCYALGIHTINQCN